MQTQFLPPLFPRWIICLPALLLSRLSAASPALRSGSGCCFGFRGGARTVLCKLFFSSREQHVWRMRSRRASEERREEEESGAEEKEGGRMEAGGAGL